MASEPGQWPPLLTVVGATAGALAGAWLIQKWTLRDQPPGPVWFLPFIGETPGFIQSPGHWIWRQYKQYHSPVFRTHVLGDAVIAIGDPDLWRGPMSDSNTVDALVPVKSFTKLMGNIYNMRGEHHKIFRKYMVQALGYTTLQAALPEFEACITKHLATWLEASQQQGGIDMTSMLRELFADLAVGPVLGLEGAPPGFAQLITNVQAGLFCAPIYFPGTQWYKAINLRGKYLDTLAQLLEARFPPAQPGGPLRLEAEAFTSAGCNAIKANMQDMVDMGLPLEPKEVAVRAMQTMVGATETTAASVYGILVTTAARPDVQAKLREEQAALIKSRGRGPISWQDLTSGMPYLDAVVRESLRLVPAAHGTWRLAKADFTVAGYRVRKGQLVLVASELSTQLEAEKAALAAGHPPGSPEAGTLTQPPAALDCQDLQQAFKPERWLQGGPVPSKLNLFGYGPHQCAGRDLAIMESKLILALITRACSSWQLQGTSQPHIVFFPFTHLREGGTIKFTPNAL